MSTPGRIGGARSRSPPERGRLPSAVASHPRRETRPPAVASHARRETRLPAVASHARPRHCAVYQSPWCKLPRPIS